MLNKILNPAAINEEEKLAVSDKIVPQEEVAEENEIKDVKTANVKEENQEDEENVSGSGDN